MNTSKKPVKTRRQLKSKRRGASSYTQRDSKHADIGRLAMRSLLGVALLASLLVAGIHAQRFFVIDVEQVALPSKLDYVEQGFLADAVEPWLVEGFFSVDVHAIKRTLEEHPWVYQATVTRAWPHGLHIAIEEQQAIARWGARGYINADGDVFVQDSEHQIDGLPILQGPQSEERRVMQRYLELSGLLNPQIGKIVRLEVDDLHTLSALLDNGMRVLFGSADLAQRVKHLNILFARGDMRGVPFQRELISVDLRYNNGAALRWQEREPEQAVEPTPEEIALSTRRTNAGKQKQWEVATRGY